MAVCVLKCIIILSGCTIEKYGSCVYCGKRPLVKESAVRLAHGTNQVNNITTLLLCLATLTGQKGFFFLGLPYNKFDTFFKRILMHLAFYMENKKCLKPLKCMMVISGQGEQ